MTHATPRMRASLLLCIALAPMVSASTCDDVDLSGRYAMSLEAGEGSAMGAWRQPFVGRLAVDYGLTNVGETDATYMIEAQVQTSGASTDAACDALERSSTVEIELAPVSQDNPLVPADGAALALLRDPGTTWATAVPDGNVGFAELRVRQAGTWAFSFDRADVDLTVLTGERTVVVPSLLAVGADGCSVLGVRQEVPLDEGTYRLRIETPEPASLRMHIDETCATRRTVPRTCPGATSDIVSRQPPPTLSAGAFSSGRLATGELGIGDEVVVQLSCASPADCAGELELFFVVEQLACRTDNDCTNVETCSTDGYCLRSAASGCAAGGGSAAWWWLPLALSWLCHSRRPRMRLMRDDRRSTCNRACRPGRSPGT